jgi:hypothetical protein
MSVVVGEGAAYSWSVSQDMQTLNVYLTDDPLDSEIYTTPVDLAPVIPDMPLAPPPGLAVSSIDPVTLALSDVDKTLIVHGTAFRDTTVIVFNNVVIDTTYVSPVELNSIVSATMAPGGPQNPVAGTVPVQVQQDETLVPVPPTITFSFTGTYIPIQPSGVTPGTPGSFTPEASTIPANLAALTALGALGETVAWLPGQYVVLGDASEAYWNGTAWTVGRTPALATGATAGTPGTWTPAESSVPATFTALQNASPAVVAAPLTAWTPGQHVVLGNAAHAYWDSVAWVSGNAP